MAGFKRSREEKDRCPPKDEQQSCVEPEHPWKKIKFEKDIEILKEAGLKCGIGLDFFQQAFEQGRIPLRVKCKYAMMSNTGCPHGSNCFYAHTDEELKIFGTWSMGPVLARLRDLYFGIDEELYTIRQHKNEIPSDDFTREENALNRILTFERTHSFKPLQYVFNLKLKGIGILNPEDIEEAFYKAIDYGQLGYDSFSFAFNEENRRTPVIPEIFVKSLEYEKIGISAFSYVFLKYDNDIEEISKERLKAVFIRCLDFKEKGIKWLFVAFCKRNLNTGRPLLFVRSIERNGLDAFVSAETNN